jgi:hypothetical protein
LIPSLFDELVFPLSLERETGSEKNRAEKIAGKVKIINWYDSGKGGNDQEYWEDENDS